MTVRLCAYRAQIADGLERGSWVGVCNADHVAAASLPHFKPFVEVAEKIGRYEWAALCSCVARLYSLLCSRFCTVVSSC